MSEESSPAKLLVGVFLGVIVLAAIAVGAILLGTGGDDPETTTVVIPAGTGERRDAGEDVELVPQTSYYEVGDRFVIVNEDDRLHTVGPFTARPGETFEYTFEEPGVLEGICTLRESGTIRFIVT